jgi:integrase
LPIMTPTSELERTVQNNENRTETGQKRSLSGVPKKVRLSKDHQDFWLRKLKRRSYSSNGKRVEIPEWQVRLFLDGREDWFNLGTTNRAAASVKARDIWLNLRAHGWEDTLAKFKPSGPAKETLTVEGFSDTYREAIQRIEYPPSPQTAARYLKSLGFISRRVHVTRIADLTSEKVKKFVGDYLEEGRAAGRHSESVKVSCNAMLRNTAAIFSRQMLSEYRSRGLTLMNPFEGQKLRRIKLKSYSPMNRDMLNTTWQDAAKLRDGNPETPAPAKITRQPAEKAKRWKEPDFRLPQPGAYVLLLLELGLGLRRHEADKAQWDWFFTDANGRYYLEVKSTPYFVPKSKESRVIPVEKLLYDAIQGTREQVSPFIVRGRLPKRYESGHEPKNIVYRCDQHHRTLALWLRRHGIADEKPCHTLRKEFGSYVATAFGLFHAQRMLGHSSPQVTEQFYAGLTQLPELNHAKMRG